MIDVDAILFRAAAECQSNEETRYYLNGVYVHPHPEAGVVLVGTDGHRMLCCHDITGKCDKPAIVKVDMKALAAVKIDKNAPDEKPRLTVDAEGHATVGTYRSLKSAIIDGTFPAYDKVLLPVLKNIVGKPVSPAFFKADYLARFSKLAVLLDSSSLSGAMQLITYGEGEPAVVRFGGISHAFGIIMPVRAPKYENWLPIFMKSILEPAKSEPEQVKKAA